MVCLGSSWSSKERAAIRDCKIILDAGHIPILYCLKNSFIDREAQKFKVKIIYHDEWNTFNFFKIFKFSRFLRQLNISLVHAYDITFLLKIIFAIWTIPQIPLVFSLFQELKKSYRSFFNILFIGRVDMVVVPFSEMEENVFNAVGIKSNRVKVCGAGILYENIKHRKKIPRSVALSIKPHISKFAEISTLLNTAFMFQTRGFTDFKVFIHYEGIWNESPIYKDLKNHILAYKLEENFIFVDEMSIFDVSSQVELWLQLEDTGKLDDGMLMALISGTPVLIPRNGVNIELLETYQNVGESYKIDDVREFKQKLQYVFNNLSIYRDGIENCLPKLAVEHGLERYKTELLTGYRNVILRRERINTKLRT